MFEAGRSLYSVMGPFTGSSRKKSNIRLSEVWIQTKKDDMGAWFAGYETFLVESSLL